MPDPTCSVCGAPLAEGVQFCPVCGNPVGAYEQDDDETPRRRRLARVAIAAVLIFALAFGSILTLLVFLAGRNGFSPSAERAFLTACVQGGSPASSCRCALTELEKRYTPAEFESALTQIGRTGTIPERFAEALSACSTQPSSSTTPADA